MKFSNYWTVADGNDTMITLWNPTSSAEDVVATFYFGDGGGKYMLSVHLAGQASTMIDMAMLIAENQPDPNNKVFPPNVRDGSVEFASSSGSRAWMNLVVASGTYNVTTATCGENCVYCCGDSGFGINPSGFDIGDGDVMACASTAVDCNGTLISPVWSSSNTAVMTVAANGNVTGVSIGTADIIATWDNMVMTNGQVCFSGGQAFCPTSSPTAQSGGTVVPSITGSGNTIWYFNGQSPSGYAMSVLLTSSGGSGTQWAVTTGSYEVRLSSTTGSSITVTSSGTAFSSSLGDVAITATVTGNEQNYTSTPFTITTRHPYSLVPDGGVQTDCDPTYGYISKVPYEMQDQLLTNLPSSIGINESWTTDVVPDYSGTNWRRGNPGGTTTAGPNYAYFFDGIQGEASGYTPTAACSGSNTAVQHWGQEWWVGSATSGSGAAVQTDTLQKNLTDAAHTGITTPLN